MAYKEPDLQTYSNGKYIFELFPREYVELNVELNTMYHPKLAKILAQFGEDDIDMKLAQIAAYVQITLDGDYDFDRRVKLCGILLERLKEVRQDPAESSIIVFDI